MGFPVMILAELALKVASKALDKKTATAELEREIKANPVLKNDLNEEAPWQSRVAVGSIVAALSVVIPYVASLLGFQITEGELAKLFNATITLWGAGYALWGRFMPGLKPLGG